MTVLGLKEPIAPGSRLHATGRFMEFRGGARAPLLISKNKKGRWALALDTSVVGVQMIASGTFFKFRVSRMTDKVAEATEVLDGSIDGFAKSMQRFDSLQDGFVQRCKRASGNVRDASEKLAQGIERVEKAANFERLERYVTLLERAATAMSMLADLEASGKLDKIASAMR